VLVVEINAVGSEALQRFLDYFSDMLWLAVKSAAFCCRSRIRCDNDLVAEKARVLLRQALRLYKGRKLRCIEERDALFTSGRMT